MGSRVKVELFEESFSDDNWIKLYGLSSENVLDYFACSQFYDRACNNETCKMQGFDPKKMLPKMSGSEYVLVPGIPEEPRLFVILKRHRKSESQTTKLGIYYVLDKTIYQAPNLHVLLVSRLVKTCHHVQNAMDLLEKAVRFNPSEGYTWDFPDNKNAADWRVSADVAAFEARQQRKLLEEKNKISNRINLVLRGLVEDFVQTVGTPDTEQGPQKRRKRALSPDKALVWLVRIHLNLQTKHRLDTYLKDRELNSKQFSTNLLTIWREDPFLEMAPRPSKLSMGDFVWSRVKEVVPEFPEYKKTYTKDFVKDVYKEYEQIRKGE